MLIVEWGIRMVVNGIKDEGKHQRVSRQEWIGFNTRTNNLTNPDEAMNALFHETSHKGLHHNSKNDAYVLIGEIVLRAYLLLKIIEVRILIRFQH